MSSTLDGYATGIPESTQKSSYRELDRPTGTHVAELVRSYDRLKKLDELLYDHDPIYNHIGLCGQDLTEQEYMEERARFGLLLSGFTTREALEFGLMYGEVPNSSEILEEYDRRNPPEGKDKDTNTDDDNDDSYGFMGAYIGIIPATIRDYDEPVGYMHFNLTSRNDEVPLPTRIEMLRVGANV